MCASQLSVMIYCSSGTRMPNAVRVYSSYMAKVISVCRKIRLVYRRMKNSSMNLNTSTYIANKCIVTHTKFIIDMWRCVAAFNIRICLQMCLFNCSANYYQNIYLTNMHNFNISTILAKRRLLAFLP